MTDPLLAHFPPEKVAAIRTSERITGVSRRAHLDHLTSAEQAVVAAVDAVESMPPDVRLTQAVILLQQARDKIADFVDGRAST
jgi:hypothetical protein